MNIYQTPLAIVKPLAAAMRLFPRSVLDLRYYVHHKSRIDWRNPKNIHQYALCQLFRKGVDLDLYARLADKVAVRDFVRERIGEQYLNELYGVYESADEIDLDRLPRRFVLKTNNGCGNNLIVRDKKNLDQTAIRKKLKYWLRFPYGDLTGQRHYSRIRPLILAEKYLEQSPSDDTLPYDYKFMCFRGVPRFVLFYEGRTANTHVTPNMLFDMDWNPLPHAVLRPTKQVPTPPLAFERMKQCACKLCEGLEFVRVDFYEIQGQPIFGEMTLTPDIMINIREDFDELMKMHLLAQ